MEELTYFTFNYEISIIGEDDYNDKFLILILIQNGYKIKHFILGLKSENITIINEYYSKIELSTSNKNINDLIENSDVIIINNYSQFKKYYNLEDIKILSKNKKFPIIINQKFEVYLPEYKKYYNIFDDKELMAFSGILGSLRPQQEYISPFIPKVNIFEIILKVIYISLYVNFSILNKLDDNIVKILNKPFLNLLYIYYNVYKNFILKNSDELDKGNIPILPNEHYNYFKTKDNKNISVGNLEGKFRKNFSNVLEKLDDNISNEYNFDNVKNYFMKHNRDELFVKFFNTETCVAPVLNLSEALEFQKNLNKNINLNVKIKNKEYLEKLIEIETYLFPNNKEKIIIDLNPKIFIDNHLKPKL